MTKPSLRHIAGELEISPAYLSYMVNGKRPWRKDLYQRYVGVVNIFVNSEGANVNKETDNPNGFVAFSDFTSKADSELAVSGSAVCAGAGEEIRTLDFLLGKQTLYH